MNVVELSGVDYSPGRGFRIAGLELTVPEGSVYGFLGPNGAGKTTTLRLVMGLLRARSGRIQVLGEPMPGQAATVLARVGYVPEQPHFDSLLTVREILRFQAAFYRRWDWTIAERLLLELQLPDERSFGKLSKGQKAKLMMLTVLAQRPDLLVLDEPTDGLDPVARRDILVALLDYVAERRATVMISSHLVHELEGICTWVGVMDAGSLVVQLPMDTFRAGIKRLRFDSSPPAGAELPCIVLSKNGREPGGASWVVREWRADMASHFADLGAPVREVIDLGLEDGYVELLRAFRHPVPEA